LAVSTGITILNQSKTVTHSCNLLRERRLSIKGPLKLHVAHVISKHVLIFKRVKINISTILSQQ
jgi:hypothetical protein